MTQEPADLHPDAVRRIDTLTGLAAALRHLRRRHARRTGDSPLTYREMAAKTGWALGAIGEYFNGKTLPPTDRFDVLLRMLDASAAEQGRLATARDQVEELRRGEHVAAEAARAASPEPAPAGDHAVPRQLPPDVSGFVGRTEELAYLEAISDQAQEQPTAAVITALAGMAGVGKTALAVHWAHQIADRYPDGQLYVNLRGFDPGGKAMDPAEAVRRLLDALGVQARRIPSDLDSQAALYRSELAGKRILILLDNARDSAQIRPLLPGSAGCLVLVTSRNHLTGLVTDSARPLTLGLLGAVDARQLLARRLGPDRIEAEPQAVREVIAQCAGLPLALAIVAARAAINPRLPLAALAGGLRDTGAQLRTLASAEDPSTDLLAVFSWSYQALSPQAALLFRLLGLHPGPDLSTAAAASLSALPPRAVRPVLAELAQGNLLTEHTPDRYAFHDLLRAYATELAHQLDTEHERHAAAHRILDYYLHSTHAAMTLLDPIEDPVIEVPPQPGVVPEVLADAGQALAWFTTEHPVLLAAVEQAATSGFDTHTWQLAWTLRTFLGRRGQWHEWGTIGQAAMSAARRLDDPGAQSRAHRMLARVHMVRRARTEAQAELQYALDMAVRAGDPVQQGHAHYVIATVQDGLGRHRSALDHAQRALELYASAAHRVGQANALNAVGWCQARLGDHAGALTACRRALTLLRQLGDRDGEANTWDSIGYAHHHLGNHREAMASFHRAIDLWCDLGNRYCEAEALTHLGDTNRALHDLAAARENWQRARTLLAHSDHHREIEELSAKLAALDDDLAAKAN